MTSDLGMIAAGAFGIGLTHTLAGPDHYLPFIAMARAGRWSQSKAMLITVLCGVGHVGSSVVLGMAGIAAVLLMDDAMDIEATRGDLAGWLLVGFGMVYAVWGLIHAVRNRPHSHLHVHPDGTMHSHQHVHQGEHLHAHEAEAAPRGAGEAVRVGGAGEIRPEAVPMGVGGEIRPPPPPLIKGGQIEGKGGQDRRRPITPWVLFTIFLFGPCEPLIPLIMVPAASGDVLGVVLVCLLFAVATLAVMTTVVFVALRGFDFLRIGWLGRLGRFSHAAAGAVILACGVAVKAGLWNRIFPILAATTLALLVATGIQGYTFHPAALPKEGPPPTSLHFLAGLTAALSVVLVMSIAVTWFIGTGRWCREVGETYRMGGGLVAASNRLKRRTFPHAVMSMLVSVAMAALGAAADPAAAIQTPPPWGLTWAEVHHGGAILGTVYIGLAYTIAWRNIGRQRQVISEVVAAVQKIRQEKGLEV